MGVEFSLFTHTSVSVKVLNLVLMFQLVEIILIQLVKSYSIISTCDNYIDLTCEFELASI